MGYGPCENGEWQAPEVVIICFVLVCFFFPGCPITDPLHAW